MPIRRDYCDWHLAAMALLASEAEAERADVRAESKRTAQVALA